jgi:hypothetical protein
LPKERDKDEVNYPEAEIEWWDALGLDDDDSVFSASDDENTSDAESEDLDCVDDDVDGESKIDLSQELTLEATMNDYSTEATVLFSTTQMDNLKQKEKVLVERRKHGYYRAKDTHPEAYAKIIKVYEPYISRNNLAMLRHE